MSVVRDRRSFILGLGAMATPGYFLSRLPIAGVTATAVYPRRASGEVATAIAIGSAIVGALSAMTASDGGLSAMLQASHARLGIIIDKLEDIQGNLAEMMNKIDRIDEVMANELAAESQRQFHDSLRTDIEAFRQFYSKWDPSMSQAEWLASSRVAPELQDIRNRISRNTANANAANRFDITTGLIESVYAFLDLSVAAMIGYTPYEIARTAAIHIGWIDRIVDFGQPGSAAAWLKSDGAEHADLEQKMRSGPVLKNFDPESGNGVHSCVGVNDYKAKSYWDSYIPCPPVNFRSNNSNEKLYRISLMCQITHESPERIGPQDRIHRPYTLTEIDAVEQGQALGYRLYDLQFGDIVTGSSGSKCDWEVVRQNMPSAADRAAYMRKMQRFVTAEGEISQFRSQIARINVLRARMALASVSISAALKTKATLQQDLLDIVNVPSHEPLRSFNASPR